MAFAVRRDAPARSGNQDMVTIFSTPKAFHGHIGVIQRNAIGSWTRLEPAPQVILYGDSEGTRETAEEFGVQHIPAVETNEFGTPFLHALIGSAEERASHKLLCYINADIILTAGYERALRAVQSWKERFLLVGARMNLDLDVPLPFDGDWRSWLEAEYRQRGAVGCDTGIDMFTFPKGFYKDIPALAIGRAWFDQWMIKAALQRGAVLDSSALVPIVHQNHDYAHVAGGRTTVFHGVEAERNLALCGGEHAYTLLDCTHKMSPEGRIQRIFLRRPIYKARVFLWRVAIEKTFPIRKKLGLRKKPRQDAAATTVQHER
jgi:hypothetical protein